MQVRIKQSEDSGHCRSGDTSVLKALFFVGIIAISWGAVSQHSPKSGGADNQDNATAEGSDSPSSGIKKPIPSDAAQQKPCSICCECEKHGRGFWVIFLEKLPDPINVITGIIAVLTLGILIQAVIRERKELRAYVALDDIFFRWKPVPGDPTDRLDMIDDDGDKRRPKIRVQNFGHTPANKMMIRTNGIKTNIGNTFEKTYESRAYQTPRQMLAPTQGYSTWAHLHGHTEFNPRSFYDPNLILWVI